MRKQTSLAELNLLGIVGYSIEVIPNVPDAQQEAAQRLAYEAAQTGQCLAGGYTYCLPAHLESKCCAKQRRKRRTGGCMVSLPVNRESTNRVESEDFLDSNTDSDSFMRDDFWHEMFR